MLKIPSFRQLDDVTVYQDDEAWYRFFLVPSIPSIRRDANGRPVFLLATYHFSEQAREENPELGRGGGHMNFDVQFSVTPERAQVVHRELQSWVDQEYTRRRADPQYSALAEYASTDAPRAEFVDPLLSGGTVKMHTTQSSVLTTARFAEAPASLVSGSTAVFSVDLTEQGSNFMKGLLVDEDGTGQVDLTPIQVVYDLKMWARLPPVTITVQGDSERVHKTMEKLSETNRDNACTPQEVETYRENGVNSSNLTETGAVTVTIDQGDATLPAEVIESLRTYALDLFDTMVKERFLVPAEEAAGDLEFDDDDPDIAGRDAGWAAMLYPQANFRGTPVEVSESMQSLRTVRGKVASVKVRSGHRVTLFQSTGFRGGSKQLTRSLSSLGRQWTGKASSVRVSRPPTSRYKVRSEVNHSSMNLRIEIERSQVVEWPTGGQATLETFFSGASAAEIARHVVDIDDDFFQSLRLKVAAFADFEGGDVRAVEVEVAYPASEGTSAATDTFTFPGDEGKSFDPALVDGRRDYRFRQRVIHSDGEATEFTEWETSTSRDLNVSVADPGQIELDVSGASLRWEILRAVQVELAYEDPEGGHEPVKQSIELTQLNPGRSWKRVLRRELRGNLKATVTYHLTDDKVVQGEPQEVALSDTLFMVPPPQVDALDVSLVPAGEWSDVAQAVVSLEYDAGGGITFDRTFQLTSIEQFVTWTVLLRDPTQRQFRYKTLIVYKSGDSDESEWITESGDQALPILAKGVPRLRVNVLPALVDFATTPLVTVTLSHGEQRDTLSFTQPETKSWEAPIAEGAQRDYLYEVKWHRQGSEPIVQAPQRTGDTELVIPSAPTAREGALEVAVRGFAVDFAATPMVDVVLVHKDGDHEDRKIVTLTPQAPNAGWSVPLQDPRHRTFSYQVVYNLASGERVDGPSGTTDDPVISVVAHQP